MATLGKHLSLHHHTQSPFLASPVENRDVAKLAQLMRAFAIMETPALMMDVVLNIIIDVHKAKAGWLAVNGLPDARLGFDTMSVHLLPFEKIPLTDRTWNTIGTLTLYFAEGHALQVEKKDFTEVVIRIFANALERLQVERERHEFEAISGAMADSLRGEARHKDQFLAILAHELRNPLAPMGNAFEVMHAAKVGDPLYGESVKMIERQFHQIVRLVDDLMDVARINSGRIKLRRERMTLGQALSEAIETVRPAAVARNLNLHVGAMAEDIEIDGDPVRVSQIFVNILNNAIQYNNPNGAIWVAMEAKDGQAVVHVRDNGIGLPPEKLKQVFKMFYQAEDVLHRRHDGLGIGLTLAKILAELHGGRVEGCSPGEGEGCEFIVSFPLINRKTTGETEISSEGAAEMAGKTLDILIVDDNPESAKTLGWMMEMFGHHIHLAHNGPAALDLAKVCKPNVVLLDIGLPGMSGYEICREMKNMPDLKDTTFIAQTGWDQQKHRDMSKEAGFDHHLVKPIGLKVIQEILEGV